MSAVWAHHFLSEVRDKSFERDEGSVGRLAEFMAIEGSCCEGKRETIRDSRDHSGSPLPVCLCPPSPVLAVPSVRTEKTRFKLGLQDSITRKRRALLGFPCG